MTGKRTSTLDSERNFNLRLAAALLLCALAADAFAPTLSLGREMKKTKPPVREDVEREYFFFDEPERKDPFIAGLLSWAWPGLGQFYTQEYAKGSFYLLSDMVQKGLSVYLLFYYSDKYSASGSGIVRWDDMSSQDRGVVISYLFSVLLLKVICVVDAVNSAEKYNRDIYFPHWKSERQVSFSFGIQTRGFNFGVTTSF